MLRSRRSQIFLLAAIASLLLFWHLGSGSLCSWDEGFYGNVSQEIIRTGNWIDLKWAGMPWNDKPPLYMWVTALVYGVLGVNELSVRLFSALCGIATVLAVYFMASEIYSKRAAFASSLVLLSTWHFIWSSRIGMLDMPLTFFMTLSFLFFLLGEKNVKYLLWSPLAFAMAFMVKGWAALTIPGILLIYILFSGNARVFRERYLWTGIFISAVIIISWHVAVFSRYGTGFIKDYFLKHLVMRTTTAVEGHTGGIFTYTGVIPNKGRPWGAVGLALIPVMAFMAYRRGRKEQYLPVIWAVTVITLFSAVRTKLHWYIIPAYPALAVMTGQAMTVIFRRYTKAAVLVLACSSVAYLGMDKGIFDLDYSPEVKRTALQARASVPAGNTLMIFDVSDPGMQFYLWDGSYNIKNEGEFAETLSRKDVYLITSTGALENLPSSGYTTVFSDKGFTVIKTD